MLIKQFKFYKITYFHLEAIRENKTQLMWKSQSDHHYYESNSLLLFFLS